MVITPTAGVGLSVLENAIDRYLIRRMEGKSGRSRLRKILLRSTMNPNRTFANVLRMKVPWHRDNRRGVSQVQLSKFK